MSRPYTAKTREGAQARVRQLLRQRAESERYCVRLQAERERLRAAVLWALGFQGHFREPLEGEGPFHWRRELLDRSGISYADLEQLFPLNEVPHV